MSLTQKLSNAGVNAEIDALTALLNGGFLDLFDSTGGTGQPATADTAIGSQIKLASIGLGNPAFGGAVAGVATANATTPDSDADATGTATWFRAYKSDHTTVVMDGSVGASGSNLNLNTTSIVQHAQVSIDSWTLTGSKS